MTGHMLLAQERLAAIPVAVSSPCRTLKLLTPTAPRAVKTPQALHFHTLSSFPLYPRLDSLPKLAIDSWVSSSLPVSASSSPADQANDTGFDRKRLVAFVSGGGSNFRTLHEACLQNKIFGDFVLVVSDKPACKACDFAKENSIPVVQYPYSKLLNTGLSPVELLAALRQFEVDIVILAGYLKLLPSEVVQVFPRAILNIHPALLPAFGGKGYYGRKVHEAVVKSGARFSGPTVHFVDEKYDHGSIVAQRVVPVLPYDTPDDLAARVLKEEHALYPEVVAAACEDRIFWREDGVPLIRRSWDDAEYY